MDHNASSALGRPELTTAQLAERVQIPAGTLRMWEARYGFPSPHRLPSGHRRYTSGDADRLRAVVRLRAAGMSLPAAIVSARARAMAGPASIYARVRERCPDLQTVVLAPRGLLQLTRAIEDEYLEHGGRGVVIGSFEREPNFRAAEPRWRRLARAADLAVALADFPSTRRSREGIWEVPVSKDHALGREWSLLLYSPAVRGALAGWELPSSGDGSGSSRRFEVLLCAEPAAVHAATAAAAELVQDLIPELGAGVLDHLGPAPAQSTPELRAATALSFRAVQYMLAGSD